MLGTLVNTGTIIIGSAIGALARRGLSEKYQNILYAAMGLAAVGIGINAIVQNMPNSSYPVLFIASLAIGGVLGTALDINGRFARFVDARANKSEPSSKSDIANKLDAASTEETDANQENGSSKETLSTGLATAIMIFCIGALSILGPINSALYGDETYLLTNATLDLVTSMVLASTFGFGIAAAAVVLFCWQGSIWLLAGYISPYLQGGLMCEITIVGGFMILASGLGILKIKDIPVMNFLPALLIPPIWFAIAPLIGM